MVQDRAYINGKWVPASSGKTFEVLNPANFEPVASVPDMEEPDVQRAIEAASLAQEGWQSKTAKERSVVLKNWYELIKKNSADLAQLLTSEQGKPLKESITEIEYGMGFVEWFAEEAKRVYGEVAQSSVPSRELLFIRRPIGVVALITPWNFPIAMITRKASAALSAGCTVVIKPAEDTPLSALALAELADRAKFPPGVFNVVTCSRENVPKVGKCLCDSTSVAGLSFTGSSAVGKILYQQCAPTVKRVSLELGGNAPFIIFDSANLDVAVQGAVQSKFRNAGQTCISANRILVQAGIYDRFVEKLVEAAAKQQVLGNGMDPKTTQGPLINKAQFTKVEGIVNDAVSKGAKVSLGGKRSSAGELFFEPTVISNVNPAMRIYQEEIFGPVASLIKFETEEEALKIANSTRSGLAGYFYSEDCKQIWRVAKKLEVGMVGINDGLISAVEAAFGGIKESGFGREGTHHAIEEFTYVKYLCFGNLN